MTGLQLASAFYRGSEAYTPPPCVSFRPFVAEDVLRLVIQDSQRIELGLDRGEYSREQAEDLARGGPAWSAIGRDGRVLGVAGFRETFPGVQAVAWAILASGIGAAHLAITREAARRVAAARYRRIEMLVERRRKPMLWALRLGFLPGHVLRNFGSASETVILFERLNDAA